MKYALIVLLVIATPCMAGGRHFGFRQQYRPVYHSTYHPVYQSRVIEYKQDPSIVVNNVIGAQPYLGDSVLGHTAPSYGDLDRQSLLELRLKRNAETTAALSATLQSLRSGEEGSDRLLLQVFKDAAEVEKIQAAGDANFKLLYGDGKNLTADQYFRFDGKDFVRVDAEIVHGDGATETVVPADPFLAVIRNSCVKCHNATKASGGVNYEGLSSFTPEQVDTIYDATVLRRTMPKEGALASEDLWTISNKWKELK